eukprot:6177538-Pleurochrysis_carterae.AAC.1
MKDIRWGMAIYISLTQLLGVVGLFFVPSCRLATLACARPSTPLPQSHTCPPLRGVSVLLLSDFPRLPRHEISNGSMQVITSLSRACESAFKRRLSRRPAAPPSSDDVRAPRFMRTFGLRAGAPRSSPLR